MKVEVQVDQAVWERCTFEVEVPDGLEGEELSEALYAAKEEFSGYGEAGYRQEILDAVEGIDTETKCTLPDGTEIAL